jgi:hypothetical protein
VKRFAHYSLAASFSVLFSSLLPEFSLPSFTSMGFANKETQRAFCLSHSGYVHFQVNDLTASALFSSSVKWA